MTWFTPHVKVYRGVQWNGDNYDEVTDAIPGQWINRTGGLSVVQPAGMVVVNKGQWVLYNDRFGIQILDEPEIYGYTRHAYDPTYNSQEHLPCGI